MKKLLLAALLVLGTALPAHAGGAMFDWDRTGAEHLPCPYGANWALTPPEGIVGATIVIEDDEWNGVAWDMDVDLHVTSTDPVNLTDNVLVDYSGVTDAYPVLTLTSCVEPVLVTTPTTPPTPVPDPTVPDRLSWEIGFTVHTIRATNVSVHYIERCSSSTEEQTVKVRFKARTPLVRHLEPTVVDATTCHLRVVVWDIKPHVRPHNWPAPVVETWAEVTP